MSKYTADQVESMAHWASHLADPVRFADPNPAASWPVDTAGQMLRDYAQLLREREQAKRGVTDDVVDVALTAMFGEQFADLSGKSDAAYRERMRDALKAVWPMGNNHE